MQDMPVDPEKARQEPEAINGREGLKPKQRPVTPDEVQQLDPLSIELPGQVGTDPPNIPVSQPLLARRRRPLGGAFHYAAGTRNNWRGTCGAARTKASVYLLARCAPSKNSPMSGALAAAFGNAVTPTALSDNRRRLWC